MVGEINLDSALSDPNPTTYVREVIDFYFIGLLNVTIGGIILLY